MTEWIYCHKQGIWIWSSECEEVDCEEHCQQPQDAEPSMGDGDSYAGSRIDDPDPDEASVTVYIPEIDQACHFGPGWDSENDDTMTFIEIPLAEVFGADDYSDGEDCYHDYTVDDGTCDVSEEPSFGEEEYGGAEDDMDGWSEWGNDESDRGWE